MTNQIQILTALLLLGGNVLADSYRVHYSIRGSGRDITGYSALINERDSGGG